MRMRYFLEIVYEKVCAVKIKSFFHTDIYKTAKGITLTKDVRSVSSIIILYQSNLFERSDAVFPNCRIVLPFFGVIIRNNSSAFLMTLDIKGKL